MIFKIVLLCLYFQSFVWCRFHRRTQHSSRWINLLIPSDKANNAQVTFAAILMDHIDMLLWGISPDSSQCGPVSQVNSWKLLNIIHHSLVPPLPPSQSQNKLMIDYQLPSMKHLHATVENKKPGRVATVPAATDDTLRKDSAVWHRTGPLKKSDNCLSGVFTKLSA